MLVRKSLLRVATDNNVAGCDSVNKENTCTVQSLPETFDRDALNSKPSKYNDTGWMDKFLYTYTCVNIST